MDLMLDLETLDTKPGATVLAIGAVLFDRATTQCCGQGMFYMEVNIASQLPFHATVSADTMDWWQKTDPEWIEEVMSTKYQDEKTHPIGEVLDALDKWMQYHYEREGFELNTVWCQGQDFDFPILAELYRRVREGKANDTPPWPFWVQRDTRTAYDVAQFDTDKVERTDKKHNALANCHHQIKCLWWALNNFRLYSQLKPAEIERLAMLAEEAGEITQIVGKVLRHGYESFHPDNPSVTNRSLLENEIADLHAVQLMMEERGDIKDLSPQASDAVGHAMEKKLKFVHHQHTSPKIPRTPDAKA